MECQFSNNCNNKSTKKYSLLPSDKERDAAEKEGHLLAHSLIILCDEHADCLKDQNRNLEIIKEEF